MAQLDALKAHWAALNPDYSGTFARLDGSNSADFTVGEAIGADGLLIAAGLLALVAMFSLAGVVAARFETRQVARIARNRASSMNELLRTVRMAESIADLGVWQYDPATGEQQWSDGMRMLFGVDGDDDFVAGDAETLLYANDIDLISNVMQRHNERAPYTLRYEIRGYDGAPRSISVQACNLFGSGGVVVRIVAVVRDVTDQISRERELEHSRMAAIHEARQARELAETDALTGLANRRRVMADLDRLIIEARRFSDSLMLVVFDIDHFKQVNDTFGHIEGDKVLQRVSQIALNQARDFDLIGRVGGEEFVWIIPRTSQVQAQQMAERLRQAVSHGSSVGEVPNVTISIGLAKLSSGDTSLTLFSRADDALYAAKEAGRNLVKLAA